MLSRNSFRAVFSVLTICLASAFSDSASGETAKSAEPKVEKEFYSPKDRLEAIRKAALFTPKAVEEADIMTGPAQKKKEFQLRFNDKVICDFDKPGAEKHGNTPKFDCRITRVESPNGEVQELKPGMEPETVKVKFGADNREIYAEVVSTRLLWALGYYADLMFPVRVECHNCPANPASGSGDRSTRVFTAAVIEKKFDGHKMYEAGNDQQGWSWKEFETTNGRPLQEKDGLKLIAAFIQHSDNKAPQQRLVCEDVNVDQSTHPFTTTCGESRMLVQDVGATLGGGGLFTGATSAKMNLGEWSGKKVWKKAGTEAGKNGSGTECQANLRKSLSAHDGLGDPEISEEGRQFAAGLLCQLSDSQIDGFFRAARVSEMPEYRNHDGTLKPGVDEAAVVRQWSDVFKRKREEVASGRCRWKNEPADLTPIQNPMGLATVPNHCSAKPF